MEQKYIPQDAVELKIVPQTKKIHDPKNRTKVEKKLFHSARGIDDLVSKLTQYRSITLSLTSEI